MFPSGVMHALRVMFGPTIIDVLEADSGPTRVVDISGLDLETLPPLTELAVVARIPFRIRGNPRLTDLKALSHLPLEHRLSLVRDAINECAEKPNGDESSEDSLNSLKSIYKLFSQPNTHSLEIKSSSSVNYRYNVKTPYFLRFFLLFNEDEINSELKELTLADDEQLLSFGEPETFVLLRDIGKFNSVRKLTVSARADAIDLEQIILLAPNVEELVIKVTSVAPGGVTLKGIEKMRDQLIKLSLIDDCPDAGMGMLDIMRSNQLGTLQKLKELSISGVRGVSWSNIARPGGGRPIIPGRVYLKDLVDLQKLHLRECLHLSYIREELPIAPGSLFPGLRTISFSSRWQPEIENIKETLTLFPQLTKLEITADANIVGPALAHSLATIPRGLKKIVLTDGKAEGAAAMRFDLPPNLEQCKQQIAEFFENAGNADGYWDLEELEEKEKIEKIKKIVTEFATTLTRGWGKPRN